MVTRTADIAFHEPCRMDSIEWSIEQEREFIQQVQQDIHAFAPLYEKHYDPVYLYLYRLSANPVIAEDLTADTFMKAVQKIHTFQFQQIRFRSWLYSIAHNTFVTHYRKEKIRSLFAFSKQQVQMTQVPPNQQNKVEEEQVMKLISNLIQRLKPKDQLIITLKYFEEFSIQEIADTVNMSPANVRNRQHRALKKLQTWLETGKPEWLPVFLENTHAK